HAGLPFDTPQLRGLVTNLTMRNPVNCPERGRIEALMEIDAQVLAREQGFRSFQQGLKSISVDVHVRPDRKLVAYGDEPRNPDVAGGVSEKTGPFAFSSDFFDGELCGFPRQQ